MSIDLQRMRVWILPAVLIGLVWFAVIRILWGDWRIDPQYGYGMVVPLLILGLLQKRIPDRPSPCSLRSSQRWGAGSVLIASCLIMAFTIPMAEANPDWRALGLLASLTAVAVSLSVLYLLGGGGWLRHFAFPVCFFLIAVPWPRNFEQSVMGGLMSWNAAATLEILHWLGYEAMRQGNLIVIPSGILGVEEACSGVRSLQSGMMVALFSGEVLRLSAWRRVLLIGVAVAAALAGNILRSSLLAVVASRQGISAVSSWHDPAGLLVLLLTFGTVMGVAYRWRGRSIAHRDRAIAVENAAPCSGTMPFFLSALLLLLISLAGTEAWYRLHESEASGLRKWSLHPLGVERGATPVTIPTQTMKMLFYPEGFSERWPIGNHAGGQSFYFRWPAGRTSQQAVTMHNPEVCLSSIGMKLTRPLPSCVHASEGVTIPFRAWLFQHRGVPIYVFQALVEEGRNGAAEGLTLDDSPKGRLLAFLHGRRNRGQRMIEVAFWNLPNEQSAVAALNQYLQGALTVEMIAAPMEH
jgi:exosortase